MTNTWRLAVALGLFFLQGCTPIARYRFDTEPPHRTATTPEVTIVPMEFDEGGELFERQAQRRNTYLALREGSQAKVRKLTRLMPLWRREGEGRLLGLGCSSSYRANRQFPGRDLHPLAFETQEVSPQTETQLTSDLHSCRTTTHSL